MRAEELTRRFAHHAPRTAERVQAHETIRAECRAAAETVVRLVPAGREQALAVTALEEAMMWANAGIARASSDEAAP